MKYVKFILLFVVFFLVLAALSSWMPSLFIQNYGGSNYGFPLIFCFSGGVITWEFNALLFDLVIWFIHAFIFAKLLYRKINFISK